eukprot:gene9094-9264_t
MELDFFTHSGEALDFYLSRFPGVTASDNPLWGSCSYVDEQWKAAAAANGTSRKVEPLVRFEASATYLGHPNAAGNIKAILPKARMLTLLREPVSRAISHINTEIQRGVMEPEVESALRATPINHTAHITQLTPQRESLLRYAAHTLTQEMEVVRSCHIQYRPSLGPLYKHMDTCVSSRQSGSGLSQPSPLYQGLYGLHLERWFDTLPPEQMLIWSSADFEQTPQEHLMQLVNWLGLDASQARTDSTFCTVHHRQYQVLKHLPKEFVAQLAKFYAPYNELLFRLLRDQGLVPLADQLSKQWNPPIGNAPAIGSLVQELFSAVLGSRTHDANTGQQPSQDPLALEEALAALSGASLGWADSAIGGRTTTPGEKNTDQAKAAQRHQQQLQETEAEGSEYSAWPSKVANEGKVELADDESPNEEPEHLQPRFLLDTDWAMFVGLRQHSNTAAGSYWWLKHHSME